MNRLHPATMIVAFLPKLYDAFRSVLPFLAVSFISGRGDRTELFVAAIGVLGGFGAIAAYWTTRYGIEDSQLVCTSGWLFKRDRRLPLAQIQNVNLKQGVLERMFKVVTVEVETAAGQGSELKLQVVTEVKAEELRNQLSLLGGSKPQESDEDTATEPSGNVIYRLGRQDLFLGAMTENQGGQIIFALIGTLGAAAFVQLTYSFLKLKEMIPPWVIWLSVVAGIAMVLGFGWVYGGVQYAIKNAFFTVRRENGIFRITYGLFTKLQYAVRLQRVEMAQVTSTVWQRLVKRCTVRVGTAGSFGEQGTTVPIALMLPEARVGETLRSVLPDWVPQESNWRPLPRYYLWVGLVRSFFSFSIFGGLFLFLTQSTVGKHLPAIIRMGPIFILCLYLFLVIDQFVSYRRSGYAISEKILGVRSGFFRQTVTYMPISKIDTVGTSEPWWWRRRGVTTLVANAMVHVLAVPMIPESEAALIRQMIVAR